MPAGLWNTVLASEAAATVPALARPTCRLSCTGKEKPLAPAGPDRPTPARSKGAQKAIRLAIVVRQPRPARHSAAALDRAPRRLGQVRRGPRRARPAMRATPRLERRAEVRADCPGQPAVRARP